MKLTEILTDPEYAVRAHGALFVFWVLMTIPAVIWWSDSLLFVIFISLYAIWVAHLAAMQGALADRRVKRNHGDDGTCE